MESTALWLVSELIGLVDQGDRRENIWTRFLYLYALVSNLLAMYKLAPVLRNTKSSLHDILYSE